MTVTSSTRDRTWWAVTVGSISLAYLIGMGVIALIAFGVADGGGGSKKSAGTATTAKVSLSEFAIKGSLDVPAGPVTLDISNAGSNEHNLTLDDPAKKTSAISPGGSASLSLGDLSPGTYELYCSIPGHKEAGMKATLTVGDSGGSSTGTDGHMAASGGGTPDYAQMDEDMMKSFAAFPAKTAGLGNQVLQPTIAADGAKEFELTAEIAKWQVETGRTVDAWTYNGTVPAPMIALNVGDHVRVKVTNKLPLNTDVHWHGIEVPFAMDGVAPITQQPIPKNGGTFTYDFVVDRPYIGMYHSHMHGNMTVPNGMFGVIRVGETPIPRGMTVSGVKIPDVLAPAVDMPMVLNDAGVIGFSLNGKSFPATAPIVVNEGDWVAVTYFNEGLQPHPMHLHQFPQLITAKDGIPLDQPYWADTVLVAPGERYTVLFHADKKGTWVYHCHILNHVERETGMFGMATAVVVQ